MDKLTDLPEQDTQQTPEEDEIMKNMFGASAAKPQKGWIHTLKVAGLSAVLFVLLANPWIDALLCKMPYCEDGGMTVLAIKSLIFLILWVVMYRYLL